MTRDEIIEARDLYCTACGTGWPEWPCPGIIEFATKMKNLNPKYASWYASPFEIEVARRRILKIMDGVSNSE